jgi:hypothetical protein
MFVHSGSARQSAEDCWDLRDSLLELLDADLRDLRLQQAIADEGKLGEFADGTALRMRFLDGRGRRA